MRYLIIFLFSGIIFQACDDDETEVTEENPSPPTDFLEEKSPLESKFFSTVYVEQTSSYDPPSDGDLWPSAWADDGFLYAANGDGKGFDLNSDWSDIVMNKIEGNSQERNITGERIASGNELGPVWGDRNFFNRKPTGMVSVDGVLYLAVQDLVSEGPNIFNEAPDATILKSEDKGETWEWDNENPMFSNHVFTTIFFLDYGKDGKENPSDDYIYAYGTDHNWRDSFSDVVPDPTELFLARIPKEGLQDRDTWEFYTGDLEGEDSWSDPGDISSRKPVLSDDRRRYANAPTEPNNLSVISQGSVVYNKAFDRYIYTSWTEFTFEFYESPNPWGPWKLFLSKDFGVYPWDEENIGGYATVIPSKYISEDGAEMWISSSTFVGGIERYNFSLRRFWATPYKQSSPENSKEDKNLVSSGDFRKVAPESNGSIRGGSLEILNDGENGKDLKSYSIEAKDNDFWGYTFSRSYNFNELVYTTGELNPSEGGWFKDLRVQVRQNFEWVDVKNFHIEPTYSYDSQVEANASYIITFDEISGDGIRIIGRPGGARKYTSITELEVYYR